jgi:hypothetical protein
MTENSVRTRVHGIGLALGLPGDWVDALPKIELLPGDYIDTDYGADCFLTWKRQEFLVRTGRIYEVDHALVAEALEDAAAADGPKWLHRSMKDIMFVLAWPKRSYALRVRIGLALDHLNACIEDSPSMALFAETTLDQTWASVRYAVMELDESLPEPPKQRPWPSLDALLSATRERISEDMAIYKKISLR